MLPSWLLNCGAESGAFSWATRSASPELVVPPAAGQVETSGALERDAICATNVATKAVTATRATNPRIAQDRLAIAKNGLSGALLELSFPRQCVADDVVDVGKSRAQGEGFQQPVVVGDELGRITRASGFNLALDRHVRQPIDGIQHFHHRQAFAVAAIHHDILLRPLDQSLERGNMRRGKIADVDIIADASPVRRRIVIAIDRHVRPFSDGSLAGDLDEVGRPLADLPRAALRVRSGDVEVA